MQNQTYHLKINKTSIKCQTNELISSSVVVWMPNRSFPHWEILNNIRILLISSLQKISYPYYKGLGHIIQNYFTYEKFHDNLKNIWQNIFNHVWVFKDFPIFLKMQTIYIYTKNIFILINHQNNLLRIFISPKLYTDDLLVREILPFTEVSFKHFRHF